MRELPVTALCDMVDQWWECAQWRSPHNPEALARNAERSERAKQIGKQKHQKVSYEQRLRERMAKSKE